MAHQPMLRKFGSHHFFCTSIISRMDEVMKPMPPMT